MQLQSKNLNKVRALFYTTWKYSFKQYFEFGSVSPFWNGRENICARVDLIQLGINLQQIPTCITEKRNYIHLHLVIIWSKLERFVNLEHFSLSCVRPVHYLCKSKEFHHMQTECQKIIIHFLVFISQKLLAISKPSPLL